MLTKIQTKKLVLRDREDPAERAKYDYIIAKKIKTALDNLADIDTVLARLPKHKLQKAITDKHISTLLNAAELMMLKMDYKKIRKLDDGNLYVLREDGEGRMHRVNPTKKDFERVMKLHEHVAALEPFYDQTIKLPGYELPAQNSSIDDYWDEVMKAGEEKKPGTYPIEQRCPTK